MRKLTRARALGIGISVLLAGVLSVGGLVWASGVLRDSRGSFLRMLPPHPVEELDSINIGSNSYYFAGADDDNVYLAAYSNQFHLLKVNALSLDTQHISLHYRGVDTVKFYSPRLKVSGSYFFMVDGAVPAIYRGSLSDRVGESLKNDSIYFREFVPLSSSSFAVKSLSGKTGENIFGKVLTYSPHWQQSGNVLEKQKDGIFCTDGILTVNISQRLLVYGYYYRNQFIVMDTAFNLLYRGNTIDTISVARITPAKMSRESSVTLASPAYVVNQSLRTDGRWIFIHSSQAAKNEHRDVLMKSSIVDVYNIGTGKYSMSFYIYHFRSVKPMNEFMVIGDRMIVRYGNVLRAFKLKPEYFADTSAKLDVLADKDILQNQE